MTDLIHQLDATTQDVFSSRRDALRTTGKLGLTAALAALPFLRAERAQAQSMDGDFGILNFALTLEHLELSFYNQILAAADAAEDDDDDTTEPLIPASDRPLFDQIQAHEAAHVAFLKEAITAAGGVPVDYEDSDFTFDGFLDSYENILTLAQGLEDTGVRAYKGQAAAIENAGFLTAALQIHSVEARHAAGIRRLRGNKGWIPGAQDGAPAAIAGAYAGEGNTTQAGIDLAGALSGYTTEQITEAFDEPLTQAEVLAIAGGFITGEEGDTPMDGDGDGDGDG